ncbi:MAG: hypothetical protein QOI20_3413 [Acidimicrobiaceae bacterium]|nr:hypothetical protein [Acidimicrobiaceae bacterium]
MYSAPLRDGPHRQGPRRPPQKDALERSCSGVESAGRTGAGNNGQPQMTSVVLTTSMTSGLWFCSTMAIYGPSEDPFVPSRGAM